MPRKKKEIPFAEMMLKRYAAGISDTVEMKHASSLQDLPSLDERVSEVLQIVKRKHDKSRMLFFVMYDIESNKVRNQVVKYLIKKGCMRVQKSIFLADLEHAKYQQIRSDLVEIQACYENQDSLLVVPISTDLLSAMKIIGRNIDVDLVLKNKNTLFF
ncbi:MAG: CRISPR-associated endonuclease Cas2 [Prevotellaceae bacterium]|jgi:CRISPR-associated protein Cas2|nr:CRISPR-associated endonuclease Cas2 [Prevotellaceae bacterium]